MTTEEKDLYAQRLVSNNLAKLRLLSRELLPEELAEIINENKDIDANKVFQVLDPERAIATFENLDFEIQNKLLSSFTFDQLQSTLNKLSPDDRTALFERLPDKKLEKFLSILSDEERKVAQSLLKYPENSIGRLMTPDFISVKEEWTVQQVLDYIRANGKNSETMNLVYVTDQNGFLIDDIRAREFLLAPLDKKVSELMDYIYFHLNAKDDQEKAVNIFKQSNRNALPVTDFNGLLLGIITVDDVIDVMEEEDTEDIQKFGGTAALEEPYLNVSLRKLISKRAGWLIILFLGEMLTASAMSYFEEEITKAVVLALFIPLIISSGGNSGSQAATLIIRAMALGEVTLDLWWKVIKREIVAGFFLGLILGIIGFFRIAVWNAYTNIYGEHWQALAVTVSVSLTFVVMWGTLSGSFMPMVMKRLGFDPAASSAPFVATLVDVTGLVIYFSVAMVAMKGVM
jgi:magnesium transporter